MSCSDYPTANDAKRFKNNADSTNEFVTSQDNTFTDQDGVVHNTINGIDQLASDQRDSFEVSFSSQFNFKRIGNISDYAGQSLPEADKLNSYQFPDDSGDWYVPEQGQSFPITIPADPTVNGSNWFLQSPSGVYRGLWPNTGGSANKGDTYQTQVGGTATGQYFTALQNTTIAPINDDINWREVVSDQSLGGVTNYQAASVADMQSGLSGRVDLKEGQVWTIIERRGSKFELKTGEAANGANKISTSDSLLTAVLVNTGMVNAQEIGVLPLIGRTFSTPYDNSQYDAAQDYTSLLQAALDDGLSIHETNGGQYHLTEGVVFKRNGQVIKWAGQQKTQLLVDLDSASNKTLWSTDVGSTAQDMELSDFLANYKGNTPVGTRHINFAQPYVPNLRLHDFKSIGFEHTNRVHSWLFQYKRITASGYTGDGHDIVGTSADLGAVWAADATCNFGFKIQLNYCNPTALVTERLIAPDLFRVERDSEFSSRIQGLELNIAAEDCDGRFLYVNSDRSVIKVQNPGFVGSNPADYMVRVDAGEVTLSDFEPNHAGAINFIDPSGSGRVFLENKTSKTQINAQPHFEIQPSVGLGVLNPILYSKPWVGNAALPDYESLVKYNGIYRLAPTEFITLRMLSPAGGYRGEGINLTLKCRSGISSSPQIATGANCDVWAKTYNSGSGNVSLLTQKIPFGTDAGVDINVFESASATNEVTLRLRNDSSFDVVYVELDGISPQYLLSSMILEA